MSAKKPINILMVDDQPAKLLTYETILAELGENLIRANSGREGLEQLLRNDIAVVLVDVCMPELDGYELALMIRNHPRFRKTAIILISGVLVEDRDRLKGYVSGAVDYVSVPIVPEILRAKVAVFADLYRKTEELERLNEDLERRVRERTAEIEDAAALLRQSEERLRLVLVASGIQGWTWDLYRNEFTWVKSWGDAREMCQPFADFLATVKPGDRAIVQNAFDHAVNGGGEYYAEFRTQEVGEEHWWLGRGTVICDASGQPLSIAGINIDITERKRSEEERGVLLKVAEDARRESEKANRLKDEFLAILSHELRTPLNAITGWAHMLQAGGLDQETQCKAVETINRNALLQAQLISDLMDVSRIVSGKLRLEFRTVELRAVIQSALDTIRPAVEAKQIQIDVDLTSDPDSVRGDAARLQQVIWNLLSNATKFTPPNGHIRVSLERVNLNAELTIQDDGPGIREDFLPHIFEPFRQGDPSSTRAHQGLGLGLAIVRNLLELHGGSIQARNRQDGPGASFKAVLPLALTAVGDAANPQIARPSVENATWRETAPSLKDVRVLVVDDEPDAREVVCMILQQCGATVLVAASAMEAFAILEHELPDVLVADIEMPGEDGYSLVRRIRALPPERGGRTPAIAFTAYAGAQDRLKLLVAGFHRHVPKPLQPLELISAVAALHAEGPPEPPAAKMYNGGNGTKDEALDHAESLDNRLASRMPID